MTEKSSGISISTFVAGIVVAILASSLISVAVIAQTGLAKGPKGDTGATGATGAIGPQGLPGVSGISKIPFAAFIFSDSDHTNSTEWTDINGVSLDITTEKTSNLLIIFRAHLALQVPIGSSGSGFVRAVVDSHPVFPQINAISSEMEIQVDDKHTFTFNEHVSSGTHTVRIQWMVTNSRSRIGLFITDPYINLQVLALPVG